MTQRSRGPLDLHLRVAGRRAALGYPVRLRGVLRSEEGGGRGEVRSAEVRLFVRSSSLRIFQVYHGAREEEDRKKQRRTDIRMNEQTDLGEL